MERLGVIRAFNIFPLKAYLRVDRNKSGPYKRGNETGDTTMYGMNQHRPNRDYCATIRHSDGASQWAHVRTNMGRSVAYGMMARHFAGLKIEQFRDESKFDAYDRQGVSDSDGILRHNPNYGYGTFYEQQAGA
jgi:hypothetical protein